MSQLTANTKPDKLIGYENVFAVEVGRGSPSRLAWCSIGSCVASWPTSSVSGPSAYGRVEEIDDAGLYGCLSRPVARHHSYPRYSPADPSSAPPQRSDSHPVVSLQVARCGRSGLSIIGAGPSALSSSPRVAPNTRADGERVRTGCRGRSNTHSLSITAASDNPQRFAHDGRTRTRIRLRAARDGSNAWLDREDGTSLVRQRADKPVLLENRCSRISGRVVEFAALILLSAIAFRAITEIPFGNEGWNRGERKSRRCAPS